METEKILLILGRKFDKLFDDKAVLDYLPGEYLPIKLNVLVSLQLDILQPTNLIFYLFRIEL